MHSLKLQYPISIVGDFISISSSDVHLQNVFNLIYVTEVSINIFLTVDGILNSLNCKPFLNLLLLSISIKYQHNYFQNTNLIADI